MLNPMTRWYPLAPADADFLTSAPEIHRYVVKLPVPPARVWESLQSDRSIDDWGPGVHHVEWHAPRPFGVGTTRTVALALKAVTVRERFFRWDEGEGYSFEVYEASIPILHRMAENYVIEPDGSGALLTWTVAIEPKPRLAPVLKYLAPVNGFAFGQMAKGGKRFLTAHP
jgi:hypothetical protein